MTSFVTVRIAGRQMLPHARAIGQGAGQPPQLRVDARNGAGTDITTAWADDRLWRPMRMAAKQHMSVDTDLKQV
jgi:hypothetical protein